MQTRSIPLPRNATNLDSLSTFTSNKLVVDEETW
jgi:hypothetical protein